MVTVHTGHALHKKHKTRTAKKTTTNQSLTNCSGYFLWIKNSNKILAACYCTECCCDSNASNVFKTLYATRPDITNQADH